MCKEEEKKKNTRRVVCALKNLVTVLTHLGPDLINKDRLTVTKHLEQTHSFLKDHKVFERIKALMESVTPDHASAESIDNDITRAGAYGENSVCR